MLVVYKHNGVTTSKVFCKRCFDRRVANLKLTPSEAELIMVGPIKMANARLYLKPFNISYRCECSAIVMVRK